MSKVNYGQQESLQEAEDDLTGDSVLMELGIEPDSREMEFLIKIGKGDPQVWVHETESGQKISTRIHQNTKLLMAISSLCSNNPTGINDNLQSLTDFMELEADMTKMLVMLAVQAVDKLANGVTPIAQRLEIDPGITTGLIAASFHTKEQIEQALLPICEVAG